MICAHRIYKRFRSVDVLNGASFEIHKGTINLLTGANGSGKSTLLKILTGLIRPTSGTAHIAGHEITRSRRSAQQFISFLPQSVTFHPSSTPLQVLRFYAQLRGVPQTRCRILLEDYMLDHAADRPVSKLSGGMLQRLGLALVAIPDTPVLILDEPGLSLDPEWRRILRDKIRAQANRGKTVLLTSHFADEWENDIDAAWECRDGKLFPTMEYKKGHAP